VVELVNRHRPEPVDEDSVVRDWTAPRAHVELDARIGDEVYVFVEDFGEGRIWIDLHGEPVAAALDWAESRASELGGSRVLAGGWSIEREKLQELERRGYVLVRRSRRMEIELGGDIPWPTRPDGIEIRPLRPGEERAVYEAQQETFRDTWEPIEESFEEWSHFLLQPPRYDPELWFVATSGDAIAGFVICHPYPSTPELGWIALLGVRREWRKRGLGRALLLHAFRAFEGRGCTRVGLGVDSESPTGAHTLYERVGMRATSRFEIYEKALG
jgi:ribosomal protein S18 acetylase RimI-like enzyme